VGIGGTSGTVPDDWEIFRLDNLESEIVGGMCRVSDRGSITERISNLYRVNLLD